MNAIQEHFGPISIETLPPMRVACYRVASQTPEADSSSCMDEWVARLPARGPVRRFGFDTDVTPEQQQAGLRGYEAWRTVPADVQSEDGVSVKDFPGGLYAVMTLDKPFADPFAVIPAGWKHLHEWVIASDHYQSGNHQWMEELLPAEGYENLKLYHPIAPANGKSAAE